MRDCGDCGVSPGELHRRGCDVERCALCGMQATSCECVPGDDDVEWERYEQAVEHFGGRLPWTGEYPGLADCRELGLYARWNDAETKWEKCGPDAPGADGDLNSLPLAARWSPLLRKWVRYG